MFYHTLADLKLLCNIKAETFCDNSCYQLRAVINCQREITILDAASRVLLIENNFSLALWLSIFPGVLLYLWSKFSSLWLSIFPGVLLYLWSKFSSLWLSIFPGVLLYLWSNIRRFRVEYIFGSFKKYLLRNM